MRRRRNINKEKIVSIVVAVAILATLGVGVYSVGKALTVEPEINNIVDLNETEAPNVAFRAEEIESRNNTALEEEPVTKAFIEEEDAEVESNIPEVGDEVAEDKILIEPESEEAVVNAPAIVDPAAAYTFGKDSTLQWPVKGDIIMKYSMDSTILFKTLGVYRCNPAVMIKAELGANVGVAADGVVTNVSKSEETGTTVSVAVGSDYVVTYGQLNDVVVKAGDKVVKGQLLGTVAEPTAYYVEEGTHIYFAVTKSGVPVDPTDFLEE